MNSASHWVWELNHIPGDERMYKIIPFNKRKTPWALLTGPIGAFHLLPPIPA